MSSQKRNIFVTTALPYANGAFHIGHIMEYIQADIWVRHERMCGNTVHFVGADDAHGAPIMIAAQKKGITPQQFVAEIASGRKQYLDGFHIKFDHWHCTDSPENTALSQDIYRKLKAAGLIYTKDIEQFYDTEKGMFLADRFIKGTCPKCGAADQYGDNCEVCGSVYLPTEVINPKSTLSGTTPVMKKSTHYFFKLSDPRAIEFLRKWTRENGADGRPHVQAEVLAKDEEWLGADGNLADWDISRDAPYFGIPIPDAPGKYFYVWLDATPLSATLQASRPTATRRASPLKRSSPGPIPSRSTSSARTSSTSTRSSGPPCCTSRARPTAFPTTSTCTALSR